MWVAVVVWVPRFERDKYLPTLINIILPNIYTHIGINRMVYVGNVLSGCVASTFLAHSSSIGCSRHYLINSGPSRKVSEEETSTLIHLFPKFVENF